MNATATIHTAGTPVKGTYHGTPIEGTVVASRVHTMNREAYEVTVDLLPVSVLALRDAGMCAGATGRMIVAVTCDGGNPSSYVGADAGMSLVVA